MAPVQQIFDKLSNLPGCSNNSEFETPDFSSRKSSLYRARYRYLNVSKSRSKNIEDIQIPKQFADDFLVYVGTKSDNILIFATPLALESLKSIDSIFCDGTFKVTPKPYYQVYSCHGSFVDNDKEIRVVPLLYSLLPDKIQATYNRFFYSCEGKFGTHNTKFKMRF